ncbi:MAG: hypothetical protein H7323_08565 [Frankiales bacterium]|nr:hypothetical protein [Frankiales bacterium]
MIYKIPPDLLARPQHVLGLAWTAAHAFAPYPPSKRPGVHGQLLRGFASVWAALCLVIYLPLVVGLLGTKGLACQTRHAFVLVSKSGTPSLVSVGWLAVGVGLAVTPVCAASVYFPQASAPSSVLLGSLVALEAAALLYRSRGRGNTRARRKELGKAQLLGVTWYAAHPRGDGHGPRLLDGLFPHVPASATLLVVAANEQVAMTYRRDYGFVSYDPDHPLLLERPAAGN